MMKHIKGMDQFLINENEQLYSIDSDIDNQVEQIVENLPHKKVHKAIQDAMSKILIKVVGDKTFKMYTIDGYFKDNLSGEMKDSSQVVSNLMLALTDMYFEYMDGLEPYGGWEVTIHGNDISYKEIEEQEWD